MRAGIALGSNLGDRQANLRAARDRLQGLPATQGPLLCSAIYETDPVGCEPGAGAFLNAVVELGFTGAAGELLHVLRLIEQELGRPSHHPKNTSRTIDLDLLFFGEEQISTAELELPHPRIRERRFVLHPLADIRAELVLPGLSRTVAELLRELPDEPQLVCVATEW